MTTGGTQNKSKPQRSERLGTTRLHKPPRLVGRMWPHIRQREKPCPGRPVYAAQPREKTSATEGEAEERWEERCSDETEKSQASAKPETLRGTQTSAGRRPAAGGAGERREGSASEGVPPGSGGLGGRRRPGFSTSGETDVCSATAEQTTSLMALWRSTLSPPQQQEMAWSPHRSSTSLHMPQAES